MVVMDQQVIRQEVMVELTLDQVVADQVLMLALLVMVDQVS
jgi:hypothetical protein